VHEAIKYSVLKGDLIFADEEGVPRGEHRQARAFIYSSTHLIIL
jgi:hypothetical protein